MNQFIIEKNITMSPEMIVQGTMGISVNELVNAIRENRNGEFNHLYKSQKEK